jgi:hypothetical protein
MACIVALAATAYAEPTAAQRDRARQLYDAACTHYRLRELETAAQEFKASFELVPRPALLFNLAQTYRLLSRNGDALFFYRQYLATAQASPAERRTITERIGELQALINGQRAVENAPPVGAEPKPEPAPVQPMAPARPIDTPAPWPRSAAGWALTGGGLAIAGAGAGLLAHGVALDGQIAGAASLIEADRLAADRDRFRAAGIAMLAVGGAATVSGAIVFAVVARRSHTKLRASIAPLGGAQ